ncbi:MAG: hypothetical protein ABH873_03470 [Candidatus Firestonebacteria bacterium]
MIKHKKKIIIVALFTVIFCVSFLVLSNKSSKEENLICGKLNNSIENYLIKSFFDENGEEINLNSLKTDFFKRVVFSFSEDEGWPKEIYTAKIKINEKGKITKVKNLINLSQTADGEEDIFKIKNNRVAFATSVHGRYQSITIVKTSNKIRKLFVFNPVARKISLNWDGKFLVVKYKIDGKENEVKINQTNGMITPFIKELTYYPEIKGGESLISTLVNFSRDIFGGEFIGNVEADFFIVKDWFDSKIYTIKRFFTFKEAKKGTQTFKNISEILPNINPVIKDENIIGEGLWISEDIAKTDIDKTPVMAHTFIRPDMDKPYAVVDLLYIDSTEVKIVPVCGTVHPVSTTGLKGKGVIPYDNDLRRRVLCAFNGGFQTIHGAYGMMVDGDIILPPKDGMATFCLYADGGMKMGVWGKDIFDSPSLVSFRQNLPPLIYDGKFNKENKFWGFSANKSKSIYVWRSGIGFRKDKKVIFAIGNSLSPNSLAKAMISAGVVMGMHLDMNFVNVACEFYTISEDKLIPKNLSERLFCKPGRYLKPHTRDFFYVVRKII